VKNIFFLLILVTAKSFCLGQQPFLRGLSVKDGLPNQVIYYLYSSKAGYLYLGSEIGLIKYNGIEFELLPFKGNKVNSVDNIQENAKGEIWCMNFCQSAI